VMIDCGASGNVGMTVTGVVQPTSKSDNNKYFILVVPQLHHCVLLQILVV